ncbi:SAM-dependent methyltransferase [Pseudonocardia sp. HH130630-07]|uniref:SAM-dependent methyltransferase n=1 Tax=Pseudonocardia sp. HH130630-07 TaxID=1690815 RepID=UPI0008150D60|nr:SAM-dependent methyltransferase [Pseudonocardia sp. HH130630-07]ANY06708.1 hypothetical protein AFB00_10855 [Pseudonocardia sp. HH130630-07]
MTDGDGTGTSEGEPVVEVDLDRANPARIYDYILGGSQNFAVDREGAERLIARHPGVRALARSNRAYLRRVVEWCVRAGYDQFLDLGSGVPTVGNVHEIAHAHVPHARVAYVDIEPVAVTHARNLLNGDDRVTVTHADLRNADAVLAAPEVAGHLDFDRPIALLCVAALHYVPGEETALLADYRRRLAPGSAIAISHNSDDQDDPDLAANMRAAAELYRGMGNPPTMVLRSRAELREVLTGTELVAPGLVEVVDWPIRQPEIERTGNYGAIGILGGETP